MKLQFTKMHGLGNDFVVFNAIAQQISLSAEQIRLLADRNFGVGCDQVLLVEAARMPETDFHYRIFNADGAEVEQCGNGARCFARYVRDKGLSDQKMLRVGTAAGVIVLTHEDDGNVTVNMGQPRFAPKDIPFDAANQADTYSLTINQQQLHFGALSMGNPHAVLQVDDLGNAAVSELGPALQAHAAFPHSVNVGFMRVLDRHRIGLRVYERGSGETLACGTGACAAVVSGIQSGLLDSPVQVQLPGGVLVISWHGPGEPVWMSGPATIVFEGVIEL
jgi:diaminopimelate epimerase